jgi:hypothetical protein
VAIQTLDHLAWGLHRLYVDGLLYYGNIRQAFRSLRNLSYEELQELFAEKRFDTEAIKRRGPPFPLKPIAKEKRYLISEMACKSYGASPQIQSDLLRALTHAFDARWKDYNKAYVRFIAPVSRGKSVVGAKVELDIATVHGIARRCGAGWRSTCTS